MVDDPKNDEVVDMDEELENEIEEVNTDVLTDDEETKDVNENDVVKPEE